MNKISIALYVLKLYCSGGQHAARSAAPLKLVQAQSSRNENTIVSFII
jgi:hypothetical protein